MSYEIHIIRDEDDEIVKRMSAGTERQAEKIATGAGINLNWDDYRIEVIETAEEAGA